MKPALHTRHSSMVGRSALRVKDMTSIKLPPETREIMEAISLSIFADMCNAGHSLQAALLSVYLSGINHGSSLVIGEKP